MQTRRSQKMVFHSLVCCFFLIFGIWSTAQAGPRDDTLYWSSAAKFENLSPYYDFRPEGLAFKHLGLGLVILPRTEQTGI